MRVVVIRLLHMFVMSVRVELAVLSTGLLLHNYADFLALLLTYIFLHIYQ